jgi:hypothetical protein
MGVVDVGSGFLLAFLHASSLLITLSRYYDLSPGFLGSREDRLVPEQLFKLMFL